jgi:predicted SPOUT superfamily RNA methylase MTH1
MAIELVEADQVRSGRGGKTKGQKYGKYAIGIQSQLTWIKEQIANSSDGTIRVKNKDIRNEMGGEFVKKADGSVYWGLKFVLFTEGIVVDTGTHSDGSKLLIMRKANDDDVLPESLAKYLERDEENDGTEEPEE